MFDYNDRGDLLEWTRICRKGRTARFTQHGLKVLTNDSLGRHLKAKLVRYELARSKDGKPFLKEQVSDRVFVYSYSGDADWLGTPKEVTDR